jgi:8-oxo-dGTP pyrophosphatase MutT (NUDIX family)
MNRRQFLHAAAAAGACAPLALSRFARSEEKSDEKLFLCAPLTHSDWMLKPGIEWGEPGVRHMLDACKAAGWSRVLWRVADAGQATYASKLMQPGLRTEKDNIFDPQTDEGRHAVKKLLPNLTAEQGAKYLEQMKAIDYAQFDSLAAAVKYGHGIGLQIHAWISINEDDHGWGWASEFSKKNPQFRWVRRDGRVYRSQLSFAFPEVRAYKLALLKELLDGYAIDGLFLDWIRTGDIRDNPQNDANGFADYGYEAPYVEAFKKQTGKDPHDVEPGDGEWAMVRAHGTSRFMTELRQHLVSSKRYLPVCAMVGHPWHYRGTIDKIAGNLKGLLLDVRRWAKDGLVDSVIPAGYYRDGGTPETAYKALKEETGSKVDVWTYAWVPQNVAEFDRDYTLAKSLGAKQILFWEADYIDDRANAAELKKAMSAKSKW